MGQDTKYTAVSVVFLDPPQAITDIVVVVIFIIIIIIIISNLSNDRSKASSKTIPPHSAIYSFLLQFTVSSTVLKVIQ